MARQTLQPDAPGGLLLSRTLCGWLCLGIAAAWLLAFTAMLVERGGRELVEMQGRIATIESDRSVRQGGRSLLTSPYLSITLETPRFLDGPYHPTFRYAAPLWAGERTEGLAESLAPGGEVRITVDGADLETAIAKLAARHEAESRGEIYNPSIFGRPGIVDIVALEGGDGTPPAQVSESLLLSVLVLALCLGAAALFGAAGAQLLRRPADSSSAL